MHKKSLVLFLIGLVIVVIGSAIFHRAHNIDQAERELAESCKQKYSQNIESYIDKYDKWLGLPEEQKQDSTWLAEDKNKTPQQLRQEQENRLKADIEELASGAVEVHPLADMIYGENWQLELEEYKERKKNLELVLTSSILLIITGSGLMLGVASYWLGLWLIKLLNDKKEFSFNDCLESQEELVEKQAKLMVPQKVTRNNLSNRNIRNIENLIGQKAVVSRNQNQAGEFGNITESVQKVAAEDSRPVENMLKKLSEEMGVIRQYASSQEEKAKKLQEAYDWRIIRNFCLRIIRCIDNLESRISKLDVQGEDTVHLEEIRDELIFALESSGVEQFEPEAGTSYIGLEKQAEVLKTKMPCSDAEMAGAIAKVVRCGYQYVVDDENVKIVRPAQVQLFDRAYSIA